MTPSFIWRKYSLSVSLNKNVTKSEQNFNLVRVEL